MDFAEMKGQTRGLGSTAEGVGRGLSGIGKGATVRCWGCMGRNYELCGVGTALGEGGTVGLEDSSLWRSCSWGPASCVWHFLQPQESLLTTSWS